MKTEYVKEKFVHYCEVGLYLFVSSTFSIPDLNNELNLSGCLVRYLLFFDQLKKICYIFSHLSFILRSIAIRFDLYFSNFALDIDQHWKHQKLSSSNPHNSFLGLDEKRCSHFMKPFLNNFWGVYCLINTQLFIKQMIPNNFPTLFINKSMFELLIDNIDLDIFTH